MPFKFRMRKKITDNLFVNFGKRGVSLTGKLGPFSRTVSTTGRRTNSVNFPGPFSYTDVSTAAGGARKKEERRLALQARKDAALERRAARRNRS